MVKIPTVTLNNGVQMPMEGFGVYQINDLEECKRAVKEALATGYRLIDTAQGYQNESAVGDAIQESPVDRKDVFLTTKIWPTNYGYEETKAAVEESLKRLKTDYIDLVLLHVPFGNYYAAYHALEDLYQEGKLRAIGVSNFYPDRYIDLIHFSKVVPAVNQIENHVFSQRKVDRKYLKKYGTQVEAWSPFAEGRYNLFTNETLVNIGKKYQKTAAQVALRFLVQNGIVVIPKSTHKERIEENLDIWDFNLSDDDLAQIEALDLKKNMLDHEDPKTVEWFMEKTMPLDNK
jgi:diketogulonate reductase-like aldo/keto reductase